MQTNLSCCKVAAPMINPQLKAQQAAMAAKTQLNAVQHNTVQLHAAAAASHLTPKVAPQAGRLNLVG
jgi:hypothetical protein